MLKIEKAKYTYEETADGEKVCAKEVSSSSKKSELTVTELRDFLNELINAGYGDYSVEADTQDGTTYSVRNEVLVYDYSKVVQIFWQNKRIQC